MSPFLIKIVDTYDYAQHLRSNTLLPLSHARKVQKHNTSSDPKPLSSFAFQQTQNYTFSLLYVVDWLHTINKTYNIIAVNSIKKGFIFSTKLFHLLVCFLFLLKNASLHGVHRNLKMNSNGTTSQPQPNTHNYYGI